MREGDFRDLIKTRPVPQREELDDGGGLMKWQLEMSLAVRVHDLIQVPAKLSNENLSALVEQVGLNQLLVSVVSKPGISYTDLWDFSSRSILTVEKLLGEIVSIEGTHRDEWRLQFVVAEHSGAFAADKTPIMVAAENGDIEQIKVILSAEADSEINEVTLFGLNALGYAAEKGHLEIVELLINAGATPSAGGEVTTLQVAVLGGVRITRLLLGAGADVNGTNRYGGTALMTAAAFGKSDIVKELLKNGADPKLEDKQGKTALNLAQQNKRAEVVVLLENS